LYGSSQSVALCCGVLRCVAVWCSVLRFASAGSVDVSMSRRKVAVC